MEKRKPIVVMSWAMRQNTKKDATDFCTGAVRAPRNK